MDFRAQSPSLFLCVNRPGHKTKPRPECEDSEDSEDFENSADSEESEDSEDSEDL